MRSGRRSDALWRRFAVKGSGAWLFCVALALGSWQLVAVAGFAAVAVALGFLPVLRGRPALHDRLSATTVGESKAAWTGAQA